MKTLLIAFAITFCFAACTSKTADTTKDVVGTDTTGVYRNNMMADTASNEALLPPGATKKVVETHSPDGSVTTTTFTTAAPAKTNATPKAVSHSNGGSAHTNTVISSQAAAAPVRKSGWSNRAKGAAIGGVGGAVAGAVISKKKGKGALIGGAVGAAGGYIIGNEKDKKQGR